jgi:phosphoglycerate-specific signal transduction histidine kinase
MIKKSNSSNIDYVYEKMETLCNSYDDLKSLLFDIHENAPNDKDINDPLIRLIKNVNSLHEDILELGFEISKRKDD